MLNENDYEVFKSTLMESERLFGKLSKVADQYLELDLDESGLFFDEQERLNRHWLKLSSKIKDALSVALEEHSIELLKNKSLEDRILIFKISKDDDLTEFKVNYAQSDALSISEMS